MKQYEKTNKANRGSLCNKSLHLQGKAAVQMMRCLRCVCIMNNLSSHQFPGKYLDHLKLNSITFRPSLMFATVLVVPLSCTSVNNSVYSSSNFLAEKDSLGKQYMPFQLFSFLISYALYFL